MSNIISIIKSAIRHSMGIRCVQVSFCRHSEDQLPDKVIGYIYKGRVVTLSNAAYPDQLVSDPAAYIYCPDGQSESEVVVTFPKDLSLEPLRGRLDESVLKIPSKLDLAITHYTKNTPHGVLLSTPLSSNSDNCKIYHLSNKFEVLVPCPNSANTNIDNPGNDAPHICSVDSVHFEQSSMGVAVFFRTNAYDIVPSIFYSNKMLSAMTANIEMYCCMVLMDLITTTFPGADSFRIEEASSSEDLKEAKQEFDVDFPGEVSWYYLDESMEFKPLGSNGFSYFDVYLEYNKTEGKERVWCHIIVDNLS